MTAIFATRLGQLASTQFGVNEIASLIVIGKDVGSIFTRKSDADMFEPLEVRFGIFVRSIPKYLETINFDRSGTILAGKLRPFHADNLLEDVKLDSLEGIATFLVLILRHIQGPSDLVDSLEKLIRGTYWLVGCTDSNKNDGGTLPYSLRLILRSFSTAVADADADSPQLNSFRQSMASLVLVIGDAEFSRSHTESSEREQERFLQRLLGDHRNAHREKDCSDFDTLSAGAAIIALAAEANGANIVLSCQTRDGEKVITKFSDRNVNPQHRFTFKLWLIKPPPGVAESIRSFHSTENTPPACTTYSPLPLIGGNLEISRFVARQIDCQHTAEETLALWQTALENGRRVTWNAVIMLEKKRKCLRFVVPESALGELSQMPADLIDLANGFYKIPWGDRRHQLARKAASILHDVLSYRSYDGYSEERFDRTANFIITAYFIGCLGALSSNNQDRLSSYAWTWPKESIMSEPETMVHIGIELSNLLIDVARTWGGLHPTFQPGTHQDTEIMGLACPQTTILANILNNPFDVAHHGIQGGIYTLHAGSIPLIPRDRLSGLILAGNGPQRRPPCDVPATLPSNMERKSVPEVIYTLEPGTALNGVLSAIICGWHNGRALLELNPFTVLSGLIGERNLQGPYPPLSNELRCLSPSEILTYVDGFKARDGVLVTYLGSRADLQVAAAGSHWGSRTIMVVDERDQHDVRLMVKDPESITKMMGGRSARKITKTDSWDGFVGFKHHATATESQEARSLLLIYCSDDVFQEEASITEVTV